MKFSVYSKASGEILRLCECPDALVDKQFNAEDELFLVGHFPSSLFYVNDGQPVELPPQPSEHHVFDYTTKQWIDPRTPETEWPLVRAKRDRLLLASDWTQFPDVPLTTKEAWAVYRQALRDVTLQQDPFNIVWPTHPT